MKILRVLGQSIAFSFLLLAGAQIARPEDAPAPALTDQQPAPAAGTADSQSPATPAAPKPAAASDTVPAPGVPTGNPYLPAVNLGGRVPIHLFGYLQPRFTQQAGQNSPFSIKRARLIVDGNLDPHVDFYFQLDANLSPALLDAYVNLKPSKQLRFRVGQFKVGFSTESLLPDDVVVPVERAVVINKFSPGRDISSQGRDLGAQAYGTLTAWSRPVVEYSVGIFNGSGIYNIATNHQKALAGRVIVHPIAGLSIGGNYYEGKTGTSPAILVTKQRSDLELGYARGRFYSWGEYLFGHDGLVHRSGGYGLAAYRINKQWEVLARAEEYNAQHDKRGQTTRIYMGGINFYPYRLVKFGANWGAQKDPVTGKLSNYVLAQLQTGF